MTEADPAALRVLARALRGGLAVSSVVRRAALRHLAALIKQGTHPREILPELLRELYLLLRRYEPALARTLADADLAAFLEGGRGLLRWLPEGASPPLEPPPWTLPSPLPGEGEPLIRWPSIEAAANDLARRDLLLADDFAAAGLQARLRGFTVARVASLDALEKVRDRLIEAVVDGGTLARFREQTAGAFDASQMGPARVEAVFRTGIMTSYSRGQKAVLDVPMVEGHFPFMMTVPILDGRLTDLCRTVSVSGLEGTGVFWRYDPVWVEFANPRHWNCRCTTIPLSLRRAARRLRIAREWLDSGVMPSRERLCVPTPPVSLPKGWTSTWVSADAGIAA